MTIAPSRLNVDPRTPIGAYAKAAIVALAGVAIGLAATYVSTAGVHLFGAAASGPWTAWPKTGAMEADPYARAAIARRAEVPLGNGEGVAFIARTDSAGAPLDGACDYVIEGQPPVARFWTLAVYTPSGRLIGEAPGRRELTSSDVLRGPNGEAAIVVAPTARAGNWLAAPKGRPFALALSLYDVAASPTRTSLEALALPTIRKGDCP